MRPQCPGRDERDCPTSGRVTLAGDRTGEYLIAEERPDGSLLLRPDTSVEAILDRMGARPATLPEFETDHGRLQAPDAEG